jgi:hypothetical protein
MTKEAAFAKFATTDPSGQLLMRARKMADGADWSGDERPAGTGGIPRPVTSSAYDEAKSMSAERGITFAKAFQEAYSANPELVRLDKAYNAGITRAGSARRWAPGADAGLSQRRLPPAQTQE